DDVEDPRLERQSAARGQRSHGPARQDPSDLWEQAVIAAKDLLARAFLEAVAARYHLQQRDILAQHLARFRRPAAWPEAQPGLPEFERRVSGFFGDAQAICSSGRAARSRSRACP